MTRRRAGSRCRRGSALPCGRPVVATLIAAALAASAWGGGEDTRIPLNLDFSRPGLVRPEWPWGWFLQPLEGAGVPIEWRRGEGPGGGELVLRRNASSGDAAGWGGYFFEWPLAAGQTLAVGGRVERPPGSAAEVRLGLGLSGEAEGSEVWSEAVCGGAPAETCRVALTAPVALDAVQVRIAYTGHGEAVVGPLSLSLDGRPVTARHLPGQRPAPAAEVEWVRHHAVPLATTDPAAPLDDLELLAGVVGKAAFVLLGESTHGTREFFTLRHRLIRWLVERHGFTAVALEDNAGPVAALDHWVQTGEGDVAALAEGLFGVWERQEMVDLLRWMRGHVASGRGALSVHGIDLQNPLQPIADLEAFATTHARALAGEIAAALAPQRDAWRQGDYPRRAPEEHRRWSEAAAGVLELVESRAGEWRRRAGERLAARAVHNARLVWQSAENSRLEFEPRDRFLAQNLSWFQTQLAPGARIAVWAHNSHVRADQGAMGEHLRRLHPGRVVSFGLQTGAGSYAAYDPVRRRMAEYELLPAPPGSVEQLLAAAGHPVMALELAPARRAGAPATLTTPHYHRTIGLTPADIGFSRAAVSDGFDALLYVDRTSATRPISAPPPAAGALGSDAPEPVR